jgi:ABC-type multidrug transport system fused ATPase/permease subunit
MCFSLAWLENLLIWVVIVGALIAILQLFVPWVLAQVGDLGGAVGVVLQIVKIIIWAIIVIFVIYIVFDLIQCLMSSGSLKLPRP